MLRHGDNPLFVISVIITLADGKRVCFVRQRLRHFQIIAHPVLRPLFHPLPRDDARRRRTFAHVKSNVGRVDPVEAAEDNQEHNRDGTHPVFVVPRLSGRNAALRKQHRQRQQQRNDDNPQPQLALFAESIAANLYRQKSRAEQERHKVVLVHCQPLDFASQCHRVHRQHPGGVQNQPDTLEIGDMADADGFQHQDAGQNQQGFPPDFLSHFSSPSTSKAPAGSVSSGRR